MHLANKATLERPIVKRMEVRWYRRRIRFESSSCDIDKLFKINSSYGELVFDLF